jgi:GT2 family glycosyltransferase
MSDLLLSVGVVVYRSNVHRLRTTLESLARAVGMLDGMRAAVRLIIIDNGARDAPLDEVPLSPAHRLVFRDVEIIRPATNLGYGAGHNLVLQGGCGEFHLVLNPDVDMAPDALSTGISWLRAHVEASGVVPEGRDPAGAPLYLAKAEPDLLVLLLRAFAPGRVLRLFARRLADYELHSLCEAGEPAPVPLASGCFMLLRGSAFAGVGGFDPAYFLYFEDFDLSRRISAKGPLFHLPSMRIVHHGGNASRKGWRHVLAFGRSALRYFLRWKWRLSGAALARSSECRRNR